MRFLQLPRDRKQELAPTEDQEDHHRLPRDWIGSPLNDRGAGVRPPLPGGLPIPPVYWWYRLKQSSTGRGVVFANGFAGDRRRPEGPGQRSADVSIWAKTRKTRIQDSIAYTEPRKLTDRYQGSSGSGSDVRGRNTAPKQEEYVDLPISFRLARCFHGSQIHSMGGTAMLGWAITFLIVAIIAGVLGFGGVAGTAAWIAKVLFVVFIILFLISLISGRRRRV